ncbi:MAG TPA: glutathione binding-like protein, partial [Alphaproteobacteria bacterium]|nr:glutathione binding-like protein [Alphaproteobacteria bacterium]
GMGPALAHFVEEAERLMRILDGRLKDNAYMAGDEYTIADIATFPWCQDWERRGLKGEDYPNFMRWFDEIQARPAVQKADKIAADLRAAANAA